MANSSLPTSGGTGGNADTRTTGDGDHRQVVVLAGETDAEVGKFTTAAPAAGDPGLVVRVVGTQPVSGTVAVSGTVPVSDAGSTLSVDDGGGALTVDGTVAVTGSFWQATQPVSDAGGSLTVDDGAASLTVDNAALSVTGGGTEAGALRVTLASDSAGLLSVDDGGGSLTVDGTVAISGTVAVDSELTTGDLDTGGGTDTRAVVGLVVGASGGGTLVSTSNPLPVGDNGGSLTVDGTVAVTGTFWQATQPVSGTVAVSGTVPVSDAGGTLSVDDGAASLTIDNAALSVTGGGTEASALRVTLASDSTGVLSVDDNGATLSVDDGGGSLTVDGTVAVTGTFWQATQPVSAASLPLPTGAATEATLDARSGALTEAAPATDTASSGLNGRLQRIAQRITSLIALFPAALTGSGNFKAAIVEATATLTANPAPSTTLYDGAVTGITTTAAAMPTQACAEVLVTADPANTANLLIGNATTQSTPLQAGQSIVIPCSNVNLIYRKSASGTQAASYMARN